MGIHLGSKTIIQVVADEQTFRYPLLSSTPPKEIPVLVNPDMVPISFHAISDPLARNRHGARECPFQDYKRVAFEPGREEGRFITRSGEGTLDDT